MDGEAPTTKKVVQQTRAGLDALDKNGASRARRKAYLDDQLLQDPGRVGRDAVRLRVLDPRRADQGVHRSDRSANGKPIPDAKSSYRHFMKDVMRMLARDGLRTREQSVSAKKLATAITAENVAGAREDAEVREPRPARRRHALPGDDGDLDHRQPAGGGGDVQRDARISQRGHRRGDVIGVDIAGPEAGKFDAAAGDEERPDALRSAQGRGQGRRNRAMVLRPHVGEGYAPPGAPEGAHVETARHNMTTLLDHLEEDGVLAGEGAQRTAWSSASATPRTRRRSSSS